MTINLEKEFFHKSYVGKENYYYYCSDKIINYQSIIGKL